MVNSSRVVLREKRISDAWDDYTWDTDPELAELDAAPVLNATFSQYLVDYIDELGSRRPNSRSFAIDTLDGKHIGNCSYYDIDEIKNEAELGIMIGNRTYWNKGYGVDTITTLINDIFRQTNLNRIYLKTLESNIRAQRCFQKCGFAPYGSLFKDGFSFTLMEIYRK